MKTYSNLMNFDTFEERYRYLRLRGIVGEETFGFDRYLNQTLYSSSEWKRLRSEIILRDDGCDLGIKDRPIGGRIYIHHLNPITPSDIVNRADVVLDPEYLVCVSRETHLAIHFGDDKLLMPSMPIIRHPDDTILWR